MSTALHAIYRPNVDDILALLFRQLDNGYQDNVKCKMMEILLQAVAVLIIDRVYPVSIKVYGARFRHFVLRRPLILYSAANFADAK